MRWLPAARAAVLLGLLAAREVVAEVSGHAGVWEGLDPRDRSTRSQLDRVSSLTVVDLGLCAATAGVVDAFEAFLQDQPVDVEADAVDPTEAVPAPVSGELWLQVWRPGLRRPVAGTPSAGAKAWSLVTQAQVSWSLEDYGRVTFFDLAHRPLPMAVGDCVGWYGGAGLSAVPYDTRRAPADGQGRRPGVVWAYGLRVVRFGNDEPTIANGWAQRTYSLHVRRRPLGALQHLEEELPLPVPHADAWLEPARNIQVCAEEDLVQARCPNLEPSRLADTGPIDWRQVLRSLCSCTAGQALLGEAASTTGACCDLDSLDRALNAAGHPQSLSCMHGTFALLAACSAKLSLRHRSQQLPAGVASIALRRGLRTPRLVHLASPMRLLDVPQLPGAARRQSEEGNMDLEMEPMLGEPGHKHTFRLRSPSLQTNFAPFPFGSRDLLWWREAPALDVLWVLSDILLGLTVSSIPAIVFVGSLRRVVLGHAGAVPDVLVPWALREEVREFARKWCAAAPSERHSVDLPLRMELGLLPDSSIRAAWPSDFGFRIVCPGCTHIVIYFHFAPAEGLLVTTFPEPPCAWPTELVQPVAWRSWQEMLADWGPAAGPVAPEHVQGRDGALEPLPPQLPWPANARALLETWMQHRGSLLGAVGTRTAAEDSAAEQAALGLCWPSWTAAAAADGVPTSQLGFATLPRVSPAFNLGPMLRPGIGLYDLYDLRKDMAASDLEALADKVALKHRLLAEGLPVARVYHASYESPEVRDVLRGLERYAVKAAHRHHGGRGVVLVERGRDLKTGREVTIEEVQARVLDMWPQDPLAGQPRCIEDAEQRRQCVTNAPKLDKDLRPAVIVEELAVAWDGRRDVLADEAFCFTAWGRMCLCGVMGPGGTWAGYFARDGTPIFGQPMHREVAPRDRTGAAMRQPLPWPAELLQQVVALAEATGAALGADFVRVDVFPNGGRPLVAEVSIVSGWLGRANLQWGEVDAWVLGLLGERWLEGYGQTQGRVGL